ncbi:MAG: threonine--tRNA ligase [Candidatus Omnitrophota bacterium]
MNLDTLRHSAAHVMAQAVKALYPGAKLGIGPSIQDGFYYDFDLASTLTQEDLPKIEEKMREIIKKNYKFERQELSKEDAKKLFAKLGENYKLELIEEIPDKTISIYTDGDFTDLCKGPHIELTGEIKAFKLLSVAGAYWRGSERNKMLQRIYATAFETKDALDKYLILLEEAKKRDHRKLGKELEFFSFHEEIGAGLVLYHPKGALLRSIIEDYEKKEHLKRGYQPVSGPHILRSDIWIKSGHYDYYKELMFIFKIEDVEYAVKPMNCPNHIFVYTSKTRSYKDLPIRFFELGTVYRNEKSGVLHGMLRVRGFTQDDAHIFCTPAQLKGEIIGVINFVIDTMKTFGFNEYFLELSTRPAKSIGSDEMWRHATDALKAAMDTKGISYDVNEGEGAFYGPKIDIKLKDALGRAWQCATIQCDFALPERFDLTYVGPDGKETRPVMIHRVLLGSMERFIGTLLEHYAGALPLWLSPAQVMVIPITDAQGDYAKNIKDALFERDIRAEINLENETLNKKIRNAQLEKIPYMLIVGDKEKNNNTVSVRSRKTDEGTMKLGDFIGKITAQIKERG